MNHFPERRLGSSREKYHSRVVWSRWPPGGAVVFVHGYTGSAQRTWNQFEVLLPTRRAARDYDLYFYDYDCVESDTTAQASLLCQFLDRLCTDPMALTAGQQPPDRAPGYAYRRIILVGHSIGTIVCRRSLLFARELGHAWMDRVSLVFFAPAHSGAIVSELLKEAEGWQASLSRIVRYRSPFIDEVAPGSVMLTRLEQQVQAAVAQGATYLRPLRVLIAARERVVRNEPFPGDPPPHTLANTTHKTVCKPHLGFLDPVAELEKRL